MCLVFEPAGARPLIRNFDELAPLRLRRVFGHGDTTFRLFTMISTFGTPHDITADELRVEALFPADKATEQRLQLLDAN